jgi:hypothetical protein
MTKRFIFGTLLVLATMAMYFLARPDRPPAEIGAESAPRAGQPRISGSGPAAALPARPHETPSLGAATPATDPASRPMRPAPSVQGATPPSTEQPAPERQEPEEPLANIDPVEDVDGVRRMVRGFRNVMGENPVGTNAEITRALTGGNLKQIKMPLTRGSSVNENGELVDRWGTAYFFHQLTAEEMEVRSAGPDRQMWTADDVEVK